MGKRELSIRPLWSSLHRGCHLREEVAQRATVVVNATAARSAVATRLVTVPSYINYREFVQFSTSRLLKYPVDQRAGAVAAVYDRRNSITCRTTAFIERRFREFFSNLLVF